MSPEPLARAEVVVDLAAVRHNVRLLRELTGVASMTVVKADAYGHGLVEVGRAARAAGSEWLGVATIDEAMAVRAAGDTGRLLCWLTVPGESFAAPIEADVDVTASSVEQLESIEAAVGATGRRARVQLKVDSGLSRAGAPLELWPALVARARAGEDAGSWRVTGLWSHFAASDEPDHVANDTQEAVFRQAVALAERSGLRPEVRHLANSAAGILRPSSRFDVVRFGLASYGLDPAPGHTPDLGLRPAMTVRAALAMTKRLHAGAGVSYGHEWVARQETTVGLVPVGYADGVPRHASDRAEVWVAGRRRPLRGRVCMDQFVVDLGGDLPAPGSDVLLWGPGDRGEPTAQDWAEVADTISYEIVTRVGGRAVRRHIDTRTDTDTDTGTHTAAADQEDQP